MGTGASGGNAGDGNSIPSYRPFVDEDDELEFYTDNTEQLRILSGGNVGIGTVAPSKTLTVKGTISASSAIHTNYFLADETGNYQKPAYAFGSDSGTGMYKIAADRLGFSANAVHQLEIAENILQKMAENGPVFSGKLTGKDRAKAKVSLISEAVVTEDVASSSGTAAFVNGSKSVTIGNTPAFVAGDYITAAFCR